MNFTQFSTDLSTYGTVDFCGYNGNDPNIVIVVVSNFTPTATNLGGINMVIHNHTSATHPNLTHINISNGIVKVELSV